MNLPEALLLGGLALFLYGVQLAKEHMQRLAGDRLRDTIQQLTDNKLLGLLVGVGLTVVFQSSSATAVLLVGFGSANLISTTQAMSVLLGAAIGTTFTVQLISFGLIDYALPIITTGFVLALLLRKNFKSWGYALMGFGFIFLGMKLMGDASAIIKDAEIFKLVVTFFSDHWIWGIVFGLVLTLLFQNSAATIGFTMAVASSNILSLEGAVALVLGANIGTCSLPMIASTGARPSGRQIAISYLGLKGLGVLIAIPFIKYLAILSSWTSGDVMRQIANAHTIFNFALAIIFLPFVNLAARSVQRIFPVVPDEKFKVQYLDPNALNTPAFAFAQVTREIMRTADFVSTMLKKSIQLFDRFKPDAVEEMHDLDDKVDLLDKEIRFFLSKISHKDLTDAQAMRELELVSFSSELENIGDIIDTLVVELAEKKAKKGLTFSKEGYNEVLDFHRRVMGNFELAMSAFASSDKDLAVKVLRHKQEIKQLEEKLREAHIERLHRGLEESFATSTIHLDLLSNLRRINSSICNVAYQLIDHPKTSN